MTLEGVSHSVLTHSIAYKICEMYVTVYECTYGKISNKHRPTVLHIEPASYRLSVGCIPAQIACVGVCFP